MRWAKEATQVRRFCKEPGCPLDEGSQRGYCTYHEARTPPTKRPLELPQWIVAQLCVTAYTVSTAWLLIIAGVPIMPEAYALAVFLSLTLAVSAWWMQAPNNA